MRIGRLLQLLCSRQDRLDITAGLALAIQLPHRHHGGGSWSGRARRRVEMLAAGYDQADPQQRNDCHDPSPCHHLYPYWIGSFAVKIFGAENPNIFAAACHPTHSQPTRITRERRTTDIRNGSSRNRYSLPIRADIFDQRAQRLGHRPGLRKTAASAVGPLPVENFGDLAQTGIPKMLE